MITEKDATEILKYILRTNAAVFSSKLTTCYYRVGGAYSGGSKQHNIMRSGVSIFPICANYAEEIYLEKKEDIRSQNKRLRSRKVPNR